VLVLHVSIWCPKSAEIKASRGGRLRFVEKEIGEQVTMGAIHRMATLGDAGRLYCIRRQSILVLAPPLLAAVEAEVWAAKLSPAGMERKLRDLEIWVAELDGTVAGWGAIRGGYLEGLYTAPEFAGRGVGGDLLDLLERLMRGRGIAAVEAEASPNALAFYLRRGYRENGPQAGNGAWPIAKTL
jgi:putative acetyltransferase